MTINAALNILACILLNMWWDKKNRGNYSSMFQVQLCLIAGLNPPVCVAQEVGWLQSSFFQHYVYLLPWFLCALICPWSLEVRGGTQSLHAWTTSSAPSIVAGVWIQSALQKVQEISELGLFFIPLWGQPDPFGASWPWAQVITLFKKFFLRHQLNTASSTSCLK